eukprot:3250639-Pyramimonas_sp.AAC.1
MADHLQGCLVAGCRGYRGEYPSQSTEMLTAAQTASSVLMRMRSEPGTLDHNLVENAEPVRKRRRK